MFAAMDQLRLHSFLILFLFSSFDNVAVESTGNDCRSPQSRHYKAFCSSGWLISASGLFQTNWTGTWRGVIEAYPEGQLGHGWHKTMVIGSYPMTDETCTIWNSTFTEHGVLQLIKDYRLCRGRGATDLYVDEGNGAILAVQWINDVLVSPFKINGVFTVSSLRLRDDTLEEQVIIADDKPGAENIIVSMRAQSIHHIKMKRITNQV